MPPQTRFTIKCPDIIPNRVEVIKSLRTLTGLGLKEAKDAIERTDSQTFIIQQTNFSHWSSPQDGIEDQFRLLRGNGIEIDSPVFIILEDLRKLGADALLQGEDELANEILQLVLVEKLRRQP